jgi:AraC-like DNA-binding protein
MKPGSPAPPVKTLRGHYGSGLDTPSHSMLGLHALVTEMAGQGVPPATLLQGTGLSADQLTDAAARISHRQKIAVFGRVRELTRATDVGLRAGQRQRLADFGMYGYALATCTTFREAVDFGVRHVRVAGPVLEKRYRVEGGHAIFEGIDFLDLGDLLPLVTEFWFSSIHALLRGILERPFESQRLILPYAPPPHAAVYEEIFSCPVTFDAKVMEWHFDPRMLDWACPNANPITTRICREFCERLLASFGTGESELVRRIRTICLDNIGVGLTAEGMAARLHVSPRTLHRHLSDDGTNYQAIVDEVRRHVASEYLRKSALGVEEIAARVGYSDASNFRKAFKRWTSVSPARYRSQAFA